jgi:hypothetical protein
MPELARAELGPEDDDSPVPPRKRAYSSLACVDPLLQGRDTGIARPSRRIGRRHEHSNKHNDHKQILHVLQAPTLEWSQERSTINENMAVLRRSTTK